MEQAPTLLRCASHEEEYSYGGVACHSYWKTFHDPQATSECPGGNMGTLPSHHLDSTTSKSEIKYDLKRWVVER